MKRTAIKKISNYLLELPDSCTKQVVDFVGYLNYMKKIDSDYPYPDEEEAFKRFEKNPKTLSWDKVKHRL
jgi:hypothetical protein